MAAAASTSSPDLQRFNRSGIVFNESGFSTDACFSTDWTQFCTRFRGGKCVEVGSVMDAKQTLQTAGSLVFCDATTPGCGARPSWYCLGTAEPCDAHYDKACPGACGPTEGYMRCPVA